MFINQPDIYVVTGSLKIISDSRIRTIVSKEPKYRFPSLVFCGKKNFIRLSTIVKILLLHSLRALYSTPSRLHHRLPKSFNADAISSLHLSKLCREGIYISDPPWYLYAELKVGISTKLTRSWKGPYVITRKYGDVYVLYQNSTQPSWQVGAYTS